MNRRDKRRERAVPLQDGNVVTRELLERVVKEVEKSLTEIDNRLKVLGQGTQNVVNQIHADIQELRVSTSRLGQELRVTQRVDYLSRPPDLEEMGALRQEASAYFQLSNLLLLAAERFHVERLTGCAIPEIPPQVEQWVPAYFLPFFNKLTVYQGQTNSLACHVAFSVMGAEASRRMLDHVLGYLYFFGDKISFVYEEPKNSVRMGTFSLMQKWWTMDQERLALIESAWVLGEASFVYNPTNDADTPPDFLSSLLRGALGKVDMESANQEAQRIMQEHSRHLTREAQKMLSGQPDETPSDTERGEEKNEGENDAAQEAPTSSSVESLRPSLTLPHPEGVRVFGGQG